MLTRDPHVKVCRHRVPEARCPSCMVPVPKPCVIIDVNERDRAMIARNLREHGDKTTFLSL